MKIGKSSAQIMSLHEKWQQQTKPTILSKFSDDVIGWETCKNSRKLETD